MHAFNYLHNTTVGNYHNTGKHQNGKLLTVDRTVSVMLFLLCGSCVGVKTNYCACVR